MSKHLDGSPKPVDPVWYRKWEYQHLSCLCGHRAALQIGALAQSRDLASNTRLFRIVDRMRCSRCGARTAAVDVGLCP